MRQNAVNVSHRSAVALMPQRMLVVIFDSQRQTEALAQRIHRAGMQAVAGPLQLQRLPLPGDSRVETVRFHAVTFRLIAQQLQARLFHQPVSVAE